MAYYVGLDASKHTTSICVIDEQGSIVREGVVASEPKAIVGFLRGEGWRSAALGAATCWGVFVALSTELLSVPRLITRPALAVAWLLLA